MYEFVTTVLLPAALAVLMFGLGLSVSILDLRQLLRFPRSLLLGVVGHALCLPLIAFALGILLRLPAPIAVSLIVIAACPCGVTSNIVAFVGKADVALSISMTAISTLISLITTPLFVTIAIDLFYGEMNTPRLDVRFAVERLFLFATLPTIGGIGARLLVPGLTRRILVLLRPAIFGVLLTTVAYLALIDWHLILDDLLTIAPLALLLNLIALRLGLWLGRRFGLLPRQQVSLAIGLGMNNATMATFVAASVLRRVDYAAAPTIYGTIMVLTGLIVVRSSALRQPQQPAR
jgi:bile acid:Na+ symporter, BASS family